MVRNRPPLVPVLVLAASLAVSGCQGDAEPSTGPELSPALATASGQVLSFRQISAGFFHTCGVTTDDRAYCWGYNVSGQLGDGTITDRARPTAVAGGHQFAAVFVGALYSCGVTTDDRAYCWGENGTGQLGDGTTTQRHVPVAVAGGRHFSSVRGGNFHTCALTPFNVAFCWGLNSNGQLGDGTSTNHPAPVRVVAGGLLFRGLATAGYHTCGVSTAFRAYCWGRNEDGQLGDGTTIQKRKPVAVLGNHSFRAVIVGAAKGGAWQSISCGLTTDSRAWCWGDNTLGQVGDGTTMTRRTTPVAVSGGLQFVQLASGGVHTCGAAPNNAVYCWGSNANAQLGDGTLTGRATPGIVSGGLPFRGVTAGTFNTCGVTTTDRAYCWGSDRNGEIGDGTVTDNPAAHWTPTAVVGPS